MSYGKKDNAGQRNDLKESGWKASSYDDNVFLKDGKKASQSESGGHWVIDKQKYTNPSDAKKSGRV